MNFESAIQMQSRASGAECIAIELPRGEISDRNYSTVLDNAGRYWGLIIAAEGLESGPWAVQPGATAFNVLLFVSDLARALPLIAERLGWRGLAEARVGLLNEDDSWVLIHPSRGEPFALVQEVTVFPPAHWTLVDRAESLRKQIESDRERIAEGERLLSEMGEIRRRFEEAKYADQLGLISDADFDAQLAAIQERLEAVNAGLKGNSAETEEAP